ncbi:DUF7668 domain-containing protein [Actinoplanes philippinensis]|uniref:DUF7668 domain-containing protein n=1 Tax=Actinoplanes philippinensis TaxID=35752 RepID=UPI0033E2B21A
MGDDAVQPVKDEEREGPVAQVWRPTLAAVVDSLVQREGVLARGLRAVEPVSPVRTRSCLDAVDAYGGVTLVPLPDEAWNTSVAIWRGDHWNCLVNLWTAEEGRSDLALDADIFERGGSYRYRVNLVHVP